MHVEPNAVLTKPVVELKCNNLNLSGFIKLWDINLLTGEESYCLD